MGSATLTLTVTRAAVCCALCGWHQLERGICWSIGCPNADTLAEGVWTEDVVEIEVEVSGHLYPAEPDVGLMSGGVEDVEATFEGKPFVLTEEEEGEAVILLAERAEDDSWDDSDLDGIADGRL